jgi:predicted nucleic acid-binding protein
MSLCREPSGTKWSKGDRFQAAAILLAESLHADLLLIDERVGRKVAQERGVVVRGTLGVLVQARRSEVLPALKPVLDALVAEGFRIAQQRSNVGLFRSPLVKARVWARPATSR